MGLPLRLLHTTTLAASSAAAAAAASTRPAAARRAGPELHRSLVQHWLLMVNSVLLELGGKIMFWVLLHSPVPIQPFILKWTKLTAETQTQG